MPALVRNLFQSRVTHLLKDYDEVLLAVHAKKRQASLETMLSEQAAMSLGVYWEAFVHDLFVAYVAENPHNCIADFKTRFEKSTTDKFNPPKGWIRTKLPRKLTSAQANRLLDPKGWNISATASAKALREKANQLLHSAHARNFALSQDDSALVDFMVALRNYLAHRSSSSRERFKAALSELAQTGTNAPLAGMATNPGAYLKAVSNSGTRRVNALGHRLNDIAAALVP